MRDDVSTARQNLNNMLKLPESADRDIQADQIKSLLLIEEGNTEDGMKLLRETVTAELELPVDFGPPTIIKPSLELLGDVLLQMGKYGEAVEAYEKQLERTPKRRLSLQGKEKAMGMASR